MKSLPARRGLRLDHAWQTIGNRTIRGSWRCRHAPTADEMMDQKLVFDVGMHNGDDTAFYVERGYRVVAIEADPVQAQAGRDRFAEQIEAGTVTIVEAAIGEAPGVVSFWTSSNPEYGSFDKANALKGNNTAQEVKVLCRTMREIFAEFGMPHYLKVDIEGADHFCLEALDPQGKPQFLSFEKRRLDDLLLMRSIGYTRFKLIAQEDFRQLHFRPARELDLAGLLRRLGSGAARRLGLKRRREPDVRHSKYAYGSSGPFGEETDGPWRTLEEVAFTWLAFDAGYTGSPDPAFDDWFDIHCS
jgi:FkbM family methyltransferase